MRIILVSIHPYPSPQAVPLANAFLLSYQKARAKGASKVNVIQKEFYLDQEPADCAAELAASRPELIGFSMYVWNREQCRNIAKELKRCLPGARLFAGGPEVTAGPLSLLADELFDFLVVGEGEETFEELCASLSAGLDLSVIPGVATHGLSEPRLTPRLPLDNLDSIPSPWLSGVLDARQYQGVLWQLSRGCGFSCDYCFDSSVNRGVRRFSPERLEAELRYFVDMDVPQVFVLDSTFNHDIPRAKALLKLIKKHAAHIHFHFEVRSEFIDHEIARLFGDICCSLQIGLQSSSPDVLKAVGRTLDRKLFADKISLLNRTGAVFGFDLIYGLPGDSLRGFRDSIDFALALYPNHVDIFPLAVLPGTALAQRSAAMELRHLPEPPYTLLSSPTFSESDLAEARCLALACDVFYSRGKAVAWFNSVLAALNLKPSEFFAGFGVWLRGEKGDNIREESLGGQEIWSLQCSFLAVLFEKKKLKRYLPLVLDLVTYHYSYAAAQLLPPPLLPDDADLERLLELPAGLAPGARLVIFTYEILEILEAGEPDIRGFADHHDVCGSWAVIYPHFDGVRTESLIEPYFRLLERLDGSLPCGAVSAGLGLPDDEALSFLEFAAVEGILLLHVAGG